MVRCVASVALAACFWVFGQAGADAAEAGTGVRPIVSVALFSRHVGADQDYNETNPGLGVGLEWDGAAPGLRYSV